MKKYLHFLIAVLMILSNRNLNAAPFDTGMITLTQPNDITFTGRIWGDEFFYWAETEDGYRFVQSSDEYYYYAQLDENGEFTATEYKVGIDAPPSESYQLERTQARIDEINMMIEDFIEQVELNKLWLAQKQAEAQGQPVTLKVALILIEFQDVKHFEDENFRPDGYFTADFDSMMFSDNYWYDITVPTPHPENELVFGSFMDYWDQMSRGKLIIEGRVVNPTDEGNGVPKWLTADHNRQYYLDQFAQFTVLANEAVEKAIDAGYVSEDSTDPNYYDKFAIIYARYPIQGYLTTGPIPNHNDRYICGEQIGSILFGSVKSFTHIGLHLNSFGTTIGFYDGPGWPSFGDPNPTPTYSFCMTNEGWRHGPNDKGECPATLAPYFRLENEWIGPPVIITEDTSNFLVEYDNQIPKIYKIEPIDGPSDMYYLF